MKFKHRGSDQFNDNGWGAAYRAFQNALILLELSMPIEDLVFRFRKLWIEPATLTSCVPSGLDHRTLLYVADQRAHSRMICTRPSDYEPVPNLHVLVSIFESMRSSVFVINNGTTCATVLYCFGWKLIDPCVTASQSFDQIDLGRFFMLSNIWMVLVLAPKKNKVTFDGSADLHHSEVARFEVPHGAPLPVVRQDSRLPEDHARRIGPDGDLTEVSTDPRADQDQRLSAPDEGSIPRIQERDTRKDGDGHRENGHAP